MEMFITETFKHIQKLKDYYNELPYIITQVHQLATLHQICLIHSNSSTNLSCNGLGIL